MVRRYGPKAVCAVGLGLVIIGLGGFFLVDESTSVWLLAALFFIQGAGMANVMPPATESIMSTLPREKAGVGSAVSNTVRQVAAALGIAVLGSVLAAVYRSGIHDKVTDLPANARAAASESISGAYAAADHLGAAGRGLIGTANTSFIDAMHAAALGSVIMALVGLVVVLVWLPRRSEVLPSHPTPVETLGEQLELAEA
jgi:Na+/melibiose symporter-like transporter